jgi:hypothetical protein
MAYTTEHGNFEGRSRARGGFGNETGQTDRRGRSGEAAAANRNAINRAATLAGPRGPFKTPVYDPTVRNLATLGRIVGPTIMNPGIGLASPLAQSIYSGDVYGAFGLPSGWSSYTPRDFDPLGSNPRGNTGGRDAAFGAGDPAIAQRRAILAQLFGRERPDQPNAPTGAPAQHGRGGPRKAAGYGGNARPAPIPYPTHHR